MSKIKARNGWGRMWWYWEGHQLAPDVGRIVISVKWPDQEVRAHEVVYAEREVTSSDHGKPFCVVNHYPQVEVSVHGHPARIDLTELEVVDIRRGVPS